MPTGIASLCLATKAGNVEVVDERCYTFGSVDNSRRYGHEVLPEPETRSVPAAIHGVLLNGQALAVFGDSRCTGVHAASAIAAGDLVFLAVGGHVVCFQLQPFKVWWQLEVDDASCFGIHHSVQHDALISHGELAISRFSRDGRLLWQTGGADIFSEGFALKPEGVEAVDFSGRRYLFSYDTGAPLA